MKHLLTINENDIHPVLDIFDTSVYRQRRAARAVVTDSEGQVYLLNVSKHQYHKLPGGGIDGAEEILEALKRELLEEIGCEADIVSEIGSIVEYRDFEKLKQISYCFIAKQLGGQVPSALEAGELAEGMYEVKVKNIDEAITLLEKDEPNSIEGRFIKIRDLAFLKAAIKQEK